MPVLSTGPEDAAQAHSLTAAPRETKLIRPRPSLPERDGAEKPDAEDTLVTARSGTLVKLDTKREHEVPAGAAPASQRPPGQSHS